MGPAAAARAALHRGQDRAAGDQVRRAAPRHLGHALPSEAWAPVSQRYYRSIFVETKILLYHSNIFYLNIFSSHEVLVRIVDFIKAPKSSK